MPFVLDRMLICRNWSILSSEVEGINCRLQVRAVGHCFTLHVADTTQPFY